MHAHAITTVRGRAFEKGPIRPTAWTCACGRGGAGNGLDHLAEINAGPIDAGMDILMDDGMPAEDAAKLCLGAVRIGQDPEAFARHCVKLRRAVR